MLLLAHRRPAGRNTDDSFRHDEAGGGDGAQDGIKGDWFLVAERGAFDGDEGIDGEALRVRGEVGDGEDEADVVFWFFTEPEDAATAHVDARLAHVFEGGEAFVVGAGRDYRGVVFAACVDVVVVGCETGVFELVGLRGVDHAEGHADFHVHCPHTFHHAFDILQRVLASAHVTPGGAHAEACAPVVLCGTCGGEDAVDGGELCSLEAGAVAAGLGTVRAVFGAAAGLDVHEGAHLDGGGVVEAAVDGALVVQRVSGGAFTMFSWGE